jgi:N-acylglucosamine 2-epimerase
MMELRTWLELYRRTLLEDVVPFWMRHALDAGGGINTCIADDGRVLSRDRWSWSQWRAVWVFSKLYTSVQARPEWLEAAQGIFDFVRGHGPLADGHWPLLLDGEGRVLRGYESIYADGFAIYALAELWRATRDDALLALAMKTFKATHTALHEEEPLPAWPYPTPPGWIAHGISMLFSLAYHELAEVTGDAAVRHAADEHHQRVLNTFLRADRGVVLEFLHHDGSEIAEPRGRVVLPGHAIESMWFQMHIARAAEEDEMLHRAVEAIRRHLEIGWDDTYGGLFLAVHADGGGEVDWPYADSKLWWPHTEALYATLLAYEHCRAPWCLEWHDRLRAYSYAHYPVPGHGEWRQKLDRQGRPLDEVVALPVKDPFHLPRALIYCVEVLERLCEGQEGEATPEKR